MDSSKKSLPPKKESKNQDGSRRYTESKVAKIPDSVMRKHVFTSLDNSSLAALAKTSFYASKLAKSELGKRPQARLRVLFPAILNGKRDEVEEMVAANPHLSLAKWYAPNEEDQVLRNKAGQRIFVQGKTGFQLAVGENDTEIMAILRPGIVKAAGEKEANRQIKAQLPDGWEIEEAKRWKPVFDSAVAAFAAARNADTCDIVCSPKFKLTVREGSALNGALRGLVLRGKAILNTPVKTGEHYNSKLQEWGFKAFDEHLKSLKDLENFNDPHMYKWGDPRVVICWRRIVGYIQCLFPANYIQAACDSFYGFYGTERKLKYGEPQARSFRIEVYDRELGERVWVNDVTAQSSGGPCLGVDYAFFGGVGDEYIGIPRWDLALDSVPSARVPASIFSSLMSTKKQIVTKSMSQHLDPRRESSESFCLVM